MTEIGVLPTFSQSKDCERFLLATDIFEMLLLLFLSFGYKSIIIKAERLSRTLAIDSNLINEIDGRYEVIIIKTLYHI